MRGRKLFEFFWRRCDMKELLDNSYNDPFRIVVLQEMVPTLVEYPVKLLIDSETTKAGYRKFADFVEVVILHKGVLSECTLTPCNFGGYRGGPKQTFEERILAEIKASISDVDCKKPT